MTQKKADSSNVAWFMDHLDGKDKEELKAFQAWLEARPCDDIKWDASQSARRAWEALLNPTFH